MDQADILEQQRRTPLEITRLIALECGGFLDRESLLYRAAWLLAEQLQVPHVVIGLIEATELVLVASSQGGIEQLKHLGVTRIPLASLPEYQSVIQQGRSLVLPYTATNHTLALITKPNKPVVEWLVPIKATADRVTGMLILQSYQRADGDFFQSCLAAFDLLGTLLGLHLHTQTLHMSMLQRTSYARLLDAVRQQADQHIQLDKLVITLIDMTMKYLPFKAVALYLLEYNHLTLYAASAGFHPPMRRGLSPAIEGRSTSLNTNAYIYFDLPQHALDIELHAGTTLLGVLTMYPLLPLSPTEHEMLQEVGNTFGELIERTRLFTSMYATNERTTLFARIVNIIRQSLNIHDIIDEVNRTLALGLHCDWCSLGIVGQQSMLEWHGTFAHTQPSATYAPIAGILRQEISQALVQQQTGIIDDLNYTAQLSENARTQLLAYHVRALVWSPLQSGDQWIGVLCIFMLDQPHRWALDELRLISDVADQYMLAYRQMQLYEAEQQRRRELETLQDIISAIAGELNLEALCHNVVRKLVHVFNVSAAVVLMWRTPAEPMRPIASVGLSQRYLEQLVLNSQAVERWTERFPPPQDLSIEELADDPLVNAELVHQEGLSGLYAQPLMVNASFSGWLQIYQRGPARPFTPEARRLAAAIANQIAQAMDIARQYEDEHLLRTDAEQSYHQLRAVLEELEQTRERLFRSEKLRALGELASGVAHDFNNLLASILGNAQMLLQDRPTGEHYEALKVIEQAARDGAVTVRRIQEFARSSETIYEEVVNLEQVVEVGLEFARPSWRDKAQQRGVTVTIETDLQPAYVLGSAAELREVFVNLLVNAVDALPDGGTITIRVWQDHDTCCFSVHDTGVGISPENRARIFDPFFTTKPLSQGTGLGLSVALSIVQRHRGTFEVEPVQPHGTLFTVCIPRHLAQQSFTRPEVQPQSGARSILVVDDDPAVRQVLMRLLQKDQHTVAVATSAEQALQMLQATSYDIIISDLGMPGMNGWQLLAAARELYPDIRTMLLTGWGFQLENDHPAHTVDVIMSKPFELQELRTTIGNLVSPAPSG